MNTFRQIDWDTCTMFDVIDHSILMHPSLLIDGIRAASAAHNDYARRTYYADTRANCFRYIKENANALRDIRDGEPASVACNTFHSVIEAFNIACKLQCIPQHCRGGIVDRTQLPSDIE